MQTTFGGLDAPDGEKGNCYAACVASILDVDLSTLPNFVTWGDADWWRRTQSYLDDRFGVVPVYIPAPGRDWLPHHVLTIASGPGPRGHKHCVIHDGGGLVHDPHPSGAGLLEVEGHDLLVVSRLARLRGFLTPPPEPEPEGGRDGG